MLLLVGPLLWVTESYPRDCLSHPCIQRAWHFIMGGEMIKYMVILTGT